MNLITYAPVAVTTDEFVAFWSALYDYNVDESLYSPHIGRPLTPEVVHTLFRWKNGSELSKRKQLSVERNYVTRLNEVAALSLETDPRTFFSLFDQGGAIWRIFWLHCWQPERYPIYDQHVHRAMAYIEVGKVEEITGWSDRRKIEAYLHRYLPFHQAFSGVDWRILDRALWTFGKFIKNSPLHTSAADQP